MKKRQRGGHITGFRDDISAGSGVVFEVRRALDLNQSDMAEKLGYRTHSTIQNLERAGRVPKALLSQQRLRDLASSFPLSTFSDEVQKWLKENSF